MTYQPECRACGEDYPARRAALGYETCMDCGETEAVEMRTSWCIAPAAHKGHLTLVTNPNHLKHTNKYSAG